MEECKIDHSSDPENHVFLLDFRSESHLEEVEHVLEPESEVVCNASSMPEPGLTTLRCHDDGGLELDDVEVPMPHLQLVESLPDVKSILRLMSSSVPDQNKEADVCEVDFNQGQEQIPLITEGGLEQGDGDSIPKSISPEIIVVDKPTENAVTLASTVCCNCGDVNVNIEQEPVSGARLQELFTCEVYQSTTNQWKQNEITILDALADLFKLDKICNKQYNVLRKNTDLRMCSNCASLFFQLYHLYVKFVSLAAKNNSVIGKSFAVSARRATVKSRKLLKRRNLMRSVVNYSKTGAEADPNKNQGPTRKFEGMESSRDGRAIIKFSFGDNNASVEKSSSTKENNMEVHVHNSKSRVKNFRTPSNKHECHACNKIFDRPRDLSNHFRKHKECRVSLHGKNNKDLPTEPKIFETIKIAEDNSAETTLPRPTGDDGEFHCDRCAKVFKSAGGLKIHHAAHFRDDNKCSCKECGKKFRTPEAANLHEKTEHGGFKPHQCTVEGCRRSFRLKNKLRLHIKVVHEKQKPHPCPKCEKSFRTKYHLKIHDVNQHIQGDNSIGCSQCKRKFTTREALEMHVKSHDEEKPFVCKVCSKGFQTATRLKLHAKSHQVKPSCICAVCGKGYKHPRDLRLHEVLHQDESTYRFGCGDCSKRFYRIDMLRVHQSNEQHFSAEVIGPTLHKINGSPAKKVSQFKTTLLDSDECGDKLLCIDQKKQRRKQLGTGGSHPKSEKKSNDTPALTLATLCPIDTAMVTEESGVETILPLESIELCTTQRGLQDISGPTTFVIHPKDRFTAFPIQAAGSSSSSQFVASTIYAGRDSSDRNISGFSISAGAEQIGFDVINAFINNLN